MKEFIQRGARALFDLRLIVGVCGVVLSIVAHELFHVIVHWGEVRSISLFPDAHAIAEVTFASTTNYDLIVEEALAYTITMVTLILTAMLISDIHDARDDKTASQTILSKDFYASLTKHDQPALIDHLSSLLGVTATTPDSIPTNRRS